MRSTRRACLWLALPLAAMVGSISAATANPKVVASFSILGDLVHQVGGDDIELVVLTPAGADVHEWELTPDNFIALEDAELIFYNGYQLEQWMRQVYATVGNRAPLVPVARLSEYPTQPIVTGEFTGEPDPHLWMDPRAVQAYLPVIAEHLAELHPQAAERFHERADAASETLEALHEALADLLAEIPEERRILISTEAALVYFAEAYGFRHDGVWGINAESEGLPRQVMRIVEVIEDTRPAALFWQSTVSDRYIRSIATDTGVPVVGPLFVDSLGESGEGASNYVAMMRHNAELIRDALSVDDASGNDADGEKTQAKPKEEKQSAQEKQASKERQAGSDEE
ncbi:metal ABC transporter solute-binding protein, Zn/Mn family [Billgrantia kenyensis]|uniref:Zinc ABC transporter solute-binding protein n=1 Tax=Billgrantia kenyensis TaxID=321266 RepID=A0A7V9W1H8_9GAMM|nr:zinc ABC transporter substrate-binding protein [Halomonas kenyensis]MBA2779282.1 zinc ABC transporter substrate-binding protein [Halomonas kenyensis]MCG6660922.1 zinc ABC transporter solute-binding protein [Halomonas kenyensis]